MMKSLKDQQEAGVILFWCILGAIITVILSQVLR